MANIIETISNEMEMDTVIFDADADKAQQRGEKKFGDLCIGVMKRTVNIPRMNFNGGNRLTNQHGAPSYTEDYDYIDSYRTGYSPILRLEEGAE